MENYYYRLEKHLPRFLFAEKVPQICPEKKAVLLGFLGTLNLPTVFADSFRCHIPLGVMRTPIRTAGVRRPAAVRVVCSRASATCGHSAVLNWLE